MLVGSTASLSERVKMQSAAKMSHQHQVSLMEMKFCLVRLCLKGVSGFQWNGVMWKLMNVLIAQDFVKTIREKPQLWSDGWLLHKDNAPAPTALPDKQFLTSKNFTVMGHLPYSADLPP
ncbi:hypothetical protein TNCV_2993791 [Trichonephila clavipes]|nr:hypothetical protein TNCV_2993791 [Trichonephila clavipes]